MIGILVLVLTGIHVVKLADPVSIILLEYSGGAGFMYPVRGGAVAFEGIVSASNFFMAVGTCIGLFRRLGC